MSPRPNYFSVIPATVRYDKRLDAKEILLYGEIGANLDQNGECHAQNKYFSDLYKVEAKVVSVMVKKLIDCGHIVCITTLKEGTDEVVKKVLRLGSKNSIENKAAAQGKLFTDTEVPKKQKTPPVDWEKLIGQFNDITGKKARTVPAKAKRQIVALLKSVYTKVDIVVVIERAYKDPHHVSMNHEKLTLEFISRPEIFERYISQKD